MKLTRQPTVVIAECGVNHNGDINKALQLIDKAVAAGADVVKFQAFSADRLVTKDCRKADYQIRQSPDEPSQYEMLKRLELSKTDYETLFSYCKTKNITMLSSPFDRDSLQMLVEDFGLDTIKFGSGEITNAPLLLMAAQYNCRVILSTGMSLLSEVEQALGVLAFGYLQESTQPSVAAFQAAYADPRSRDLLSDKVTLLHCTSQYPTAAEDVNLRAMQTLHTAFQLPVGYSDHTLGTAIPQAAVALGATVIEKHFTLDNNDYGPDHAASLEPADFETMVAGIRAVEAALGSPIKMNTRAEADTRAVVRKSIVAATNIQQGEAFNQANLATLRPGGGIAPIYYWDMLEQLAKRDYAAGELITE